MKPVNGNPECLGSPFGQPPKPSVAKFTSSYSMVNRPDKNRRKWLVVILLAKTRLAMVAMLALIIGLTCFATFRLSTQASADSVDQMSSLVRSSIAGRQFDKVASFFASMEQTGTAIYTHLDTLMGHSSLSVTPEDLNTVITPIVWTMFAASPMAVLVIFISPDRLAVGFRRNGFEQFILGTNTSQVLMESTNQTYGHMMGVDPYTGYPLPNGKTLLMCNNPGPGVPNPCPEDASPALYYRSDAARSTAVFKAALSVAPSYFKYEVIMGDTNLPVVTMSGQVRNARGGLLGVISTAFSSVYINDFLQGLEAVRTLGGHAFILDPDTYMLLAVSHGKLVHADGDNYGPGAQVSLLRATESDDSMIAGAAQFLNASQLANDERPSDEDLVIEVAGEDVYLTSRYLYFQDFVLEVVLVVPKASFRGDIDKSHDEAQRLVIIMASAFFVGGCILAIIVTLQISQKVKLNVLLEEDLDEAVRENQALRTRLISVDGALEKVDMETPMQKAAKLMEEIANGRRKATPELMQQIMTLMKAKDRDMPQFLRTNGGAENLDKELADWLKSTLGAGPKPQGGSRAETPTAGMLGPAHVGKRGRHSLSGAADKPNVPSVYDSSMLSMLHAATSGIVPIPHLDRRMSTVLTGVVVESSEECELPGPKGGHGGGAAHEGGAVHHNLVEIRSLLRRTGDWSLDMMELDEKTGGQVVIYLGYSLFVASGALPRFHIDEHKLVNFLGALNRGMPDNPYHNRAHIADVANAMFHVMTSSGMLKFINEYDMLAGIVASVIHDYKHPGRNNDFLKKTQNLISLRYNDRNALECYHVAEAFILMVENPELNFMASLSDDEYMEVRDTVIDCVMGTDLKRHFELIDAFKNRVQKGGEWDIRSLEDRRLLLMMALKVADIGHSAKPWDLHIKWSDAIITEFFLQGDDEKEKDLPVSPFMDRYNFSKPKSQTGFFQFIVLPLFQTWAASFHKSKPLLSHVLHNMEKWQEMAGLDV